MLLCWAATDSRSRIGTQGNKTEQGKRIYNEIFVAFLFLILIFVVFAALLTNFSTHLEGACMCKLCRLAIVLVLAFWQNIYIYIYIYTIEIRYQTLKQLFGHLLKKNSVPHLIWFHIVHYISRWNHLVHPLEEVIQWPWLWNSHPSNLWM